MHEILTTIAECKWFADDAPFRMFPHLASTKVCIIIGPNASGKSFVRKLVYTCHKKRGIELIHLSQAARCRSGGFEGIASRFIYGYEEDDSTGYNSVDAMFGIVKTVSKREKPTGVLIDEPEIGCSEETQLAIGNFIREKIMPLENLHGLYIVTHSRHIVESLMPLNPSYCALETDTTLEAWLKRTLVPTDLNALIEIGLERWRHVERLKAVR